MTSLGRRRFLSTAVLGGAAFGGASVVGATAFGSVAPEQAMAAPGLELDPALPDPNFAEGRISAITGSMLLVTGSDRALHRIHVTDGTSLWKLRPTTFDAIKVGDGLYARGLKLDDGTLAADSVWVNIVNLTAHIAAMEKDVLHLDHHGDRVVGHVVAGTTAAVYNDTPAVSDLSLLQVGKHVQVIGAWRPDTNEVDIATVFAAA